MDAFRQQQQARRGGPEAPAGGRRWRQQAGGPDATGSGRPGGGPANVTPGGAPAGRASRFQPGLVFVLDGREPQPVRVALGLSDGVFTEVQRGLEEGAVVVVGGPGTASGGPRPSGSPGTNNPFQPQFQRRQR